MSKILKDSFIVGFALFAVFFGAGNLIFPPSIGLQSGNEWPMAIIGLFATGIFLPILSVIAVSNSGGEFENLTKPIGKWFYNGFNLFVMICIGTFITIPRTAATAYEMGIYPIFPNISIKIAAILFFIALYYFANDKSNVIDKVGKILTPALICILAIIVFKGFISPLGYMGEAKVSNTFSNAFLNAYQTGDLLTGLLCASVFISAITSKGYTEPTIRKKVTLNACIIAGSGLTFVYGGLLYIGASATSLYPQTIEKTALLTGLVKELMGNLGMIGLAIVVILACITTAIGLSASVADFISKFTKDVINYKMCIGIICLVGIFISIMGVEKIVNFAFPMFLAVYPVSIVMTLIGLFKKYISSDMSCKCAVIFTLAISILESLIVLGIQNNLIKNIVTSMPGSSIGFAWVLPAIFGFIVGYLIDKLNKGKNTTIVNENN